MEKELHDRPWASQNRSWLWRRPTKIIAAALLVLLYIKLLRLRSPNANLSTEIPSLQYLEHGDFEPLTVTGYANRGRPSQSTCGELKHDGVLRAQQNFHLRSDIIEIAHILEHHPRVDYSRQDKSLSHDEIIGKSWVQLAQSSVWLEKYQIYLAVSRVFHYDKGNKDWSCISFLRGQVYDRNWIELKNYTIHWQGQPIVFPTLFDVHAPYTVKGAFYGPEDPRILIEHDVDEAEPVIVFNMLSDVKTLKRAMYIHRPFSNSTIVMTINGAEERLDSEKNWMPFFYKDPETIQQEDGRWPSYYLHFVYAFHPLEILKCHIHNGWCDFVYRDTNQYNSGRHKRIKGRQSGGTNLEPLAPLDSSGAAVYVGFPRTHIEDACFNAAMYRPELMVMTAINNTFYFDYMSDSLDFGDKVLSDEEHRDPCGVGRILIFNSISKWDRDSDEDVMTISYTVDDSTMQIMRLSGVMDYVLNLPHIGDALDSSTSTAEHHAMMTDRATVGVDVLECSVEASFAYAVSVAKPVKGIDLRKQREELKQKEKEQEKERLKAEEEARQKTKEADLKMGTENKKEKQIADENTEQNQVEADKKTEYEDKKERQRVKQKGDLADKSDDKEKGKQKEEEKIKEMIDMTEAEVERKAAEERARKDWESRVGQEASDDG